MEFLGLPYPIIKTPRGLLATQRSLDQVKSDLLCLLLTNPGERVMLPDFGTPLRELIFEPNDEILNTRAKEMIINSIKLWEPRITVGQIEVSSTIDRESLDSEDRLENLENILLIRILFYDPENIKEIQELRLEKPLAVE